MNIEATELREHLAEYLSQIRSTGETITVCDHSQPVATLAPVPAAAVAPGRTLIDQLLAAPIPIEDFQPLTRVQVYER